MAEIPTLMWVFLFFLLSGTKYGRSGEMYTLRGQSFLYGDNFFVAMADKPLTISDQSVIIIMEYFGASRPK